MNLPLLRTAVFSLFLACLTPAFSAQVTLSFLESTSNGAASTTGQSFKLAPGDFPTSVGYLVQMQFQAGGNDAVPVFLDIYTTLSGGVFSGYVGSSTNSQVWETEVTKTWIFDGLELPVDTTYYAVFSTDSIAGNVVYRPTDYYASNVYAGGAMIYNNSMVAGYDTGFSATFETTAVPEPSTYAAMAGLAAFGLILLRRRRQR